MRIRAILGPGKEDSEVTTLEDFLSENEDFINVAEAEAIKDRLENDFESPALDCCKIVRIA